MDTEQGSPAEEAAEGQQHRRRTMTAKGAEYAKEQLEAHRKRLLKSMNQHSNELSHLLEVSNDIHLVETKQQEFNRLAAEFEEVIVQYKQLLTKEEADRFEQDNIKSDQFVAQVKFEVHQWLHNKQPDDAVVCSKARSVTSVKTHCSSGKNSSASDSRMQRMAKLAALKASKAFAAKEAQLERSHLEAEQIKKQLMLEKEMAITQAELAVFEQFDEGELCKPDALLSIQPQQFTSSGDPYSQVEPASSFSVPPREFAVSSNPSPHLQQSDKPASTRSSEFVAVSRDVHRQAQQLLFSVPPPEFNVVSGITSPRLQQSDNPVSARSLQSTAVSVQHPVSSTQSSLSFAPHVTTSMVELASSPQVRAVSHTAEQLSSPDPRVIGSDGTSGTVAESVSEVLKRTQLPKLELSVFSGDPLEFQQWLVSFENIIEDATADPARRLHYLMQYTADSAKVLVSGHALNQTAEGYKAAKEELKKEYGDAYTLARAYLKQIESWKITNNDPVSLKDFSMFLKRCRGSMSSLKHLQQLNTDLYLQKIVSKLSVPLQISWRKVVDQHEQNKKDVNFSELVDFIDSQARIAKHPVFSASALQEAEGKPKQWPGERGAQTTSSKGRINPAVRQKYGTVLATNTVEQDSVVNSAQCATTVSSQSQYSVQSKRECPKCMRSHDLDACGAYLNLTVADRRKFLIANHLCFGCYGKTSRNHSVRSCRRRRKCRICSKSHPTGLHEYRPVLQPPQEASVCASENSSETENTELKTVHLCATEASTEAVAMNIVMVQLTTQNCPPGKVTVYAALDTMSSACFMSRDVWMMLGCPGEPTEITIKTVTGESRQTTQVIPGLFVSAAHSDGPWIGLPKVYMQDELPVDVSEVPSHSTLMKYPHLSHLMSQMPDRDPGIPIGLLIGVNCPKALQPQSVIPSVDSGPYAVKTALGWCLSGPLPNSPPLDSVSCNRIHLSEHQVRVYDTGIKEMMLQMYETDFSESLSCPDCASKAPAYTLLHQEGRTMSQEDKKFLALMESEAKLVDGHYQLPLPFRQPEVSMPNNRSQAVNRAQGLKRRLMSDPKFHRDYRSFMNDLIDKGHARKAEPKNPDDVTNGGGVWYIPHHGVYHPQKLDKIRVVFDCSCKYLGSSLNSALIAGPDLTNSLVGVLIRFRKEPVAIMADIQAMFYQVLVPETQFNFLRFVWWPDGDLDADLEDYQMTVHLFGAVSSPSCANFALRKTASDNESDCGKAAAETLVNNFYVDDMLKSVSDTPTAVDLVGSVQQMCSKGGFHLTKFISNSRTVLEMVPASDRSMNVMNVNLSQSKLPIERALGVHWCVENDALEFRIVLSDKPLTRRGILSTISSIYDPLGLVAPFLLKGKQIMQHLCTAHIDWDQEINSDECTAWERWRASLYHLESVRIPRCFKPPWLTEVSAELHHFSDACQIGYGQCSYLRLVNTDNEVHSSLVMGKSRVVPAKPVTVPRLELTAATVSVKVGRMIEREVQYESIKSIYWTDSKAVLGYINNEARRFHTFVANRVQLIRDYSSCESWKYIESEMNPADDASRGLACEKACSDHRWFKGPEFLWQTGDQWPEQSAVEPVDECDSEVKKQVTVCATQPSTSSSEVISRLLNYHSSWYKLKRSIAWILVIITQLYLKVKGMKLRDMSKALTVDELQKAELSILKYVQREVYPEEISAVRKQQSVKRSSNIYRLSPIMIDDQLLAIEGRLRNSCLSAASKHQVILPNKHHVTSLIIEHFHQKACHAGKEFVLALIRENYWIVRAREAVRRVLKQCITCRKCYCRPATQKMADLPLHRVEPNSPPFTYVGVDFFGPFLVKVGRSQAKRYGCIFTCMTVRAIHIEVAHSLDTDSFINALQRFISRRGQPLEVSSDNGTNLVGGYRELRQAVQSWNSSKMHQFLQQTMIRWKFNPPTASHMGGVWERHIRTIRKLLSVLLNQQQLTDEALHTFLCIVENVVNNRPLTAVSDDPTDFEPLTPNHLLQLRRGPSLPPGEFVKQDLYCRRRWRQVQYLADVFWSRWTKEYLPTLQLRTKWLRSRDNFEVNNVVLVVDDNLPRNYWLLGRIIRTMPGSDGFVRTCEVKTKNGVFVRPVHKLCLLTE